MFTNSKLLKCKYEKLLQKLYKIFKQNGNFLKLPFKQAQWQKRKEALG